MLYRASQRRRPRVVRRRAVSFGSAPGPARGDRSRRLEAWCQVSQSVATVAALLLAVPGVVFAINTYQDQQRLNRDQQILNQEQQKLNAIALDRNDRRYASRVSFWDVGTHIDKPDMRDEVTQVKVRNMTPLPVTDIVLLADPSIRGGLPSLRPGTGGDGAYRPVVRVKSLAPCQETDVWVRRGFLYDAWQRMLTSHTGEFGIGDVPNWVSSRMYFVVAGTTWESTGRSLEKSAARVYDGVRSDVDLAHAWIGTEARGTPKPIEDCGEGD